uniref:hypothetical protein n=1 Tax=Gluconobacter thailandicus TaxID=257438 RepID=UPI000AE42E1C|nr:hypothetical protein [Gluconobacter thailandicus]
METFWNKIEYIPYEIKKTSKYVNSFIIIFALFNIVSCAKISTEKYKDPSYILEVAWQPAFCPSPGSPLDENCEDGLDKNRGIVGVEFYPMTEKKPELGIESIYEWWDKGCPKRKSNGISFRKEDLYQFDNYVIHAGTGESSANLRYNAYAQCLNINRSSYVNKFTSAVKFISSQKINNLLRKNNGYGFVKYQEVIKSVSGSTQRNTVLVCKTNKDNNYYLYSIYYGMDANLSLNKETSIEHFIKSSCPNKFIAY